MPDALVIEDHPLNRELLLDLLESEGWTARSEPDAQSGLTTIRRNPPDLVLMDIALPGLDGLSATRILKSDHATLDIPVVAITAHASEADRNAAIAAGCNGFLTKPIDLTALRAELLRWRPTDETTDPPIHDERMPS